MELARLPGRHQRARESDDRNKIVAVLRHRLMQPALDGPEPRGLPAGIGTGLLGNQGQRRGRPPRPLALAEGDFYGPDLRCDAAVGNTAGCIVMGHLADVTLSKSQFGAAAVAYEWAQQNLSTNNFGTKDKPLLRDADEKNADNRRAQSCERGPLPFKPDPTVYNDSCDEFPFAKSTQGGTNGSLCAEIIPRAIGGGQWRVDLVRGDKNTPCIRAHVDKGQNTAAGGELGRAVQSDRILDHEWYQVIITP